MPITDNSELFPISSIIVKRDERQRRAIDVASLKKSLLARGQIQAIVVRREDFTLISGERRLTAAAELGWTHIRVNWAEQLSEIESQLIELEENAKRSDLEWKDIVAAVAKLHSLHLDLDPDWTMGETAEACCLDISTVSMYLSVHGQLTENIRVSEAGSVREAYNVLKRRDARAASNALEELLAVPDVVPVKGETGTGAGQMGDTGAVQRALPDGPVGTIPPATPHPYAPPPPKPTIPAPSDTILTASFLDWAPAYSGPRFNLIHCDFPYGVELFSGPQGRGLEPSAGYTDSVATYVRLVDCLCENLDRLMSVSGHLMFWLSADLQIVHRTLETFRQKAPSLKFHKFGLVWVKSDNAGIAGDALRSPRHTYEFALLASRGERQIVQIKSDTYSAPTDKRLHPSTKPEPMLRHFFTMLVDEHTSMLDPTCGSGASIRAAESLGAGRCLGLEIDEGFAEPARRELKNSRLLRAASRGL